jgi:hypothetical protein
MSFLVILAGAAAVGAAAGLALPNRLGTLVAAAFGLGAALWAWVAIAGDLETTRLGHVLIGLVWGGFLGAVLASGVVAGAVIRRAFQR